MSPGWPNVDSPACPTPPSLWGVTVQMTQLRDSHLHRKCGKQSGKTRGSGLQADSSSPSQGAQEKALVREPSRRVDCPSPRAGVRLSLCSRTCALTRCFSAPLQTLPSRKQRCFCGPPTEERQDAAGKGHRSHTAGWHLRGLSQLGSPPDLSLGLRHKVPAVPAPQRSPQ